jgi:hypothetical protein
VPYEDIMHNTACEGFRQALYNVNQNIRAPRVCISLLETTMEPSRWVNDAPTQVMYYESVMASHSQHVQLVQSHLCQALNEYSEFSYKHCRRCQLQWLLPEPPAGICTRCFTQSANGPLPRDHAEIGQLKQDLDDVTLEANRRIEKANEHILNLKNEMKELIELEAPPLMKAHQDAKRRKEMALETKKKLQASIDTGGVDQELDRLSVEVSELKQQKAALMDSVQEIYESNPKDLTKTAIWEEGTSPRDDYPNLLPDACDIKRDES